MSRKKKKKLSEQELFLKAFRKANRELELERNNGKWIATQRIWKNKKAYNRKRDRKINSDGLFYCSQLLLCVTFFTDYKCRIVNVKCW